jgi:type IV secretory pathway VirJ component
MRGLSILLPTLAALGLPLAAQTDPANVSGLPIIEYPAELGPDSSLAVLLSGDGGWAAGDRAMAAELVHRGLAVVGLDVPSYLQPKKVPDIAGADLTRLLRHYSSRWHARRLVLIGYSHGADILPFMVSRLPADLRSRIDLVALLGLEPRASFDFHVADIFSQVQRDDALPVLPELMRLAGMRLLCVMGQHDRKSLCASLPPGLAQVEVQPGGHRISGGEGKATVDLVLSFRSQR